VTADGQLFSWGLGGRGQLGHGGREQERAPRRVQFSFAVYDALLDRCLRVRVRVTRLSTGVYPN
jgi:alpha-tubulin suppressor-like RCC1 family protein